MRAASRRHADVLGRERVRPVHPAARGLRVGERRRPAHLWSAARGRAWRRRHGHLLGGELRRARLAADLPVGAVNAIETEAAFDRDRARSAGRRGRGHACPRRRAIDRRRRGLDRYRGPRHRRGLGRRGHGLHMRRQNRRPGGVLGRQPLGTGDPARRCGRLRCRERRRDPLVRHPCRRAPDLLGRRRRRQGDAAAGHVHRGERRRQQHLRAAHQRVAGLFRRRHLRPVQSPAGGFVAVGTGTDFACAISAQGGGLRCWGRDNLDQASPPPGRYVGLSVGKDHACAIAEDSTLSCWGSNARPSLAAARASSER